MPARYTFYAGTSRANNKLFSRGDRHVASLLIQHHQTGGNWPKTLKAAAPKPDFYVERERPVDKKLRPVRLAISCRLH